MSKSILGLIMLLFASLSLRAEQPTFNVSSLDANPGDVIDIEFHVDNFSDLVSFQFSVNWDPTVLTYQSTQNFNANIPGFTTASLGEFEVGMGKLRVQWFEASITPITIADNALFFTLRFQVVGTPCESSPVAITDDPLEIEVGEGANGVDVGLIANNGTVTVPGSGCSSDVKLIGNSIIGACGSQVCIQFTVEDFIKVGAMEFSLAYDPGILEFVEFKNFAPLLAFGEGNTNLLNPGLIRVLWFDNNVMNDTLPDGTVLFEICFNVIGGSGQTSEITFGNNPPPSFTDIDNNPHTVSITPAAITAQCALEGFALIADTLCTMPGDTLCMDIRINDFDDIVAMQFSMNWDSTKFMFVNVTNFNSALALSIDNFGTPGQLGVKKGQLLLSWLDLSLQGVTLNDNAVLFTLCLKAIGAANTNSAITFSQVPLETEILNTQDSVLAYQLLQGRGEIRQSCTGCDVSYVLNKLNPTCPGVCNGVLNLTVTENCVEQPTYLWSNGETTEDLTGLCAGMYCVTITVGPKVVVACETITEPSPFSASTLITNPMPAGSSNGSILLTISGGTPPYSYHWSWNDATTKDLMNIPAGTYTVTVTDNNNCVFVPDPFIVGADLSSTITNVSCPGGSNGCIVLSVNFGSPPYTYQWSNSVTAKDNCAISAGQYCVTVTDSGGDTRNTCFMVMEPPALNVSATIVNDPQGLCTGVIDMNVTGGMLPYTYSWSNGSTTQDILNLCVGQYCVTITYGQGCTFDTCFVVQGEGLLVTLNALQYGNFQTSCHDECDGEINATVIGGTGNLSYHWSNNMTTEDLSGVCAGTYTVTVTDNTGTTATSSIVINAPPAINIAITSTNPSDVNASDGAVFGLVTGGVPNYEYLWIGPVSGTTPALDNIPAGGYTLQVTDALGCEAQASVFLPPGGLDCYQGITVITPNLDGKNDYFVITCVLNVQNHLSIFNRYGGLVYETDNYQNDWDGVDEDDNYVADGGYLWVLEVREPNGTESIHKGTVNVLRTAD